MEKHARDSHERGNCRAPITSTKDASHVPERERKHARLSGEIRSADGTDRCLGAWEIALFFLRDYRKLITSSRYTSLYPILPALVWGFGGGKKRGGGGGGVGRAARCVPTDLISQLDHRRLRKNDVSCVQSESANVTGIPLIFEEILSRCRAVRFNSQRCAHKRKTFILIFGVLCDAATFRPHKKFFFSFCF